MARAGRKRSIETRIRDAKAVELRRRGLSYEQIAGQLEFSAVSSAFEAVKRGLADTCAEENPVQAQMSMERLDALTRLFERIAATKHLVVSLGSGKVVMDPARPGQPLTDDGPVMQAGLALLRVEESRRKLKGLDAPSRTRVEVITADVIESEIARLEGELAANDRDASNTGAS
jgi:hypothetical protein